MTDPIWRNIAISSNVAAVGYDPETKTLLVRWSHSGKTSAYEDVPPEVFEQASTNWSVGTYINDQVKPNFRHRYV